MSEKGREQESERAREWNSKAILVQNCTHVSKNPMNVVVAKMLCVMLKYISHSGTHISPFNISWKIEISCGKTRNSRFYRSKRMRMTYATSKLDETVKVVVFVVFSLSFFVKFHFIHFQTKLTYFGMVSLFDGTTVVHISRHFLFGLKCICVCDNGVRHSVYRLCLSLGRFVTY